MNPFRLRLLLAAVLVPLGRAPALAGPNGASVVAGSATVQGQGTASVVVNQSSPNAIINWNTFNIGAGEATNIKMPGTSSTELDRVTGGQGPSQIFGSLTSNGQVFLVNPDGILFGKDARVNTGSFLATTHDIANVDFMAGRYNFAGLGNPAASIVNQGAITAQTGGFAALVAPGVRNAGTITATLGHVGLASANSFALDFYGDNLIKLGLNDSIASQVIDVSTGKPLKSLVSNEGTLKANGGRVELTAVAARTVVDSVINNSGVIEADTIGTHNGMIVLEAATAESKPSGAPTQTVNVSGTLSAAGTRKGTKGGTIIVTGENVQLAGTTLDASGHSGGGAVLVGGDWGGGHPNTSLVSNPSAYLEPFAVPNASTVSVDAATRINASATNAGNGGKVIVWSNEATTFYGTIVAQGGPLSGNGGFVETSGHELSANGSVDTSAAKGIAGTWLLDPLNATIASNPGSEVITVSSIESALQNGNVIVTTVGTTGSEAGDIMVASSLSWANANTLTLNAYRDININGGVTISNIGAGNLVLRADATGTGIGTVNFLGTGKVDFSQSTGTVSIFYNPADNPAGSAVNSTSYTAPFNFSSYVLTNNAVPGQVMTYMLVNSVYDLQNIQNNLIGDYALGKDIDASATASWNGGAGFVPISFAGTFDGQGHTIGGLTITAPVPFFAAIGLFSFNGGAIQNVGLTNLNIKVNADNVCANCAIDVGGLAGLNFGMISNSFVTGAIVGVNNDPTNMSSFVIGGLVGQNSGRIGQSYSEASVTGATSSSVGGLAGVNTTGGFIIQSFANGSVRGGDTGSAGGLVGQSIYGGSIEQSYSAGLVSGLSVSRAAGIGGMVGSLFGQFGVISNSYWDIQASNQSASAAGIGLSTSQLKFGLPSGFDSTVWGSNPSINNGYPYLLWTQAPPAPFSATTFSPAPPPSSVLTQALNYSAAFGDTESRSVAGNAVNFVPFQWLTAPALENIVNIAVAPFLKLLPPDLSSQFTQDLATELEKSLGNGNVTLTLGTLNVVGIVIGDITSAYIEKMTARASQNCGGGVGCDIIIGTAQYELQVAASAAITYATTPELWPTGLAGAGAAVGAGVIQSTIGDLLALPGAIISH